MTIVFPRLMPEQVASQQGFTLARVDYQASEASGALSGVQAGWPRWTASWTVGTISPARSDELEAWLTSLRGSLRPFVARDVRRPYPLAHIEGFSRMTRIDRSPFTGAGTGWSQVIDDAGNASLTVTGVPSGLRLSFNDYVELRWDAAGSAAGTGDRRILVRAIAPARAAADGSVAVVIEPPVPAFTPIGAVPHLDKPGCIMKLTTDTKLNDVDRTRRLTGSKIVAAQDLRA